jgi:hypothetical protein
MIHTTLTSASVQHVSGSNRTEYLADLRQWKKCKMQYKGKNMEIEVPPTLGQGEMRVFISAHDKTCCRTKDVRNRRWKCKNGYIHTD